MTGNAIHTASTSHTHTHTHIPRTQPHTHTIHYPPLYLVFQAAPLLIRDLVLCHVVVLTPHHVEDARDAPVSLCMCEVL
jgi:hypothetical protein